MTMQISYGCVAALGLTLGVWTATPAFADGTIETVVVTAQKHAQNAQDVGISIDAFDAKQIQALGLRSGADIAADVSGVQAFNFRGDKPTFVVRGIGTQDYEPNTAPAAATYVDEVYLGSNVLTGFQVFDIDNVEVLKGPQGTLFGRNTTAGAITYTTRKPTDTFEGYAEIGYGNYNTLSADGAIGGPITDKLEYRIAGTYEDEMDGYIKNVFQPGVSNFSPVLGFALPGSTGTYTTGPYKRFKSSIGAESRWAMRGTLSYDPFPGLSILASIHGGVLKGDTQPVVPLGTSILAGGAGPCLATVVPRFDPTHNPLDGVSNPASCSDSLSGALGIPLYKGPNVWTVSQDYVGTDTEKDIGGYLHLERDWNWATLTSITGYESASSFEQDDNDGAALWELNQTRHDVVHFLSQEVRLSAPSEQDLYWILGLYGDHDTVDETFCGALNPLLGITDFGIPAFASRTADECRMDSGQIDDSLAAYGHAEWKLSKQVSLVGGLRFTYERKNYHVLTQLFYGDGLTPASTVVNFTVPYNPSQDANVRTSYSDENVSGKFGVNYKPTKNVLLYASISRGFKSGGFDGNFAFTKADVVPPYKPETILAYEAGVKSTINDNLVLDAAAYYYDYKDPQLRVQQYSGVVPTNDLRNAEKARVEGVEANAQWYPLDGLELEAGLNLLDTRITAPNLLVGGLPIYTGNQLPLAAKITSNFLGRYEWPLNDDYRMAVQINGKYTGSYYTLPENYAFLKQSPFILLNGRISLYSGGHWELSVWGKNLTDAQYMVASYALFGSYPVSYGMPRTFGIMLRHSW